MSQETAALRDFTSAYVGLGSGASNWCRSQHFRFTPRADVGADIIELPVSAKSRLLHRIKQHLIR
jgi:hypothetical protein